MRKLPLPFVWPRRPRLWCAALLCAVLLALPLAGCSLVGNETAPDDEGYDEMIVVGFSQVGAESDWRRANTQSMLQALSEANGYKLIFEDAQQKQEKQVMAIRNFIQQAVDYIVLAPTVETGWDTVLQEAKAAGIPVIIIDRMIETSNEDLFSCWVGSDFRKEGAAAVTFLERRFLYDPVKILHLQGSIGSTPQIGRTGQLDAGIALHENWTLVARRSGEFTRAKGQEVMEEFLMRYDDFNVVYAENDNMAYGAIDALRAVGLRPGVDVVIVSFDANRDALEMTLAGEISFNVECNPLHGPRVQALIEQLEAGQTPQKFTYVEETAFDARTITQAIIDARPY